MIQRVPDVEVSRRVAASPEAVFRAFTDPATLARWFSPSSDIGTEVLELDPREGGGYRLRFALPDGGRPVVLGRFLEVRAPERLVFTWTWEPPDPHAGIETEVTVTLAGDGTGTLVYVRHARFPDREVRDRHDEGWAGTLARLAALLEPDDTEGR